VSAHVRTGTLPDQHPRFAGSVHVVEDHDYNRLVAEGAGVIFISSEWEELVGMCDRIMVMSQGQIESIVDRKEFDRHEMLKSAFGEERLQ